MSTVTLPFFDITVAFSTGINAERNNNAVMFVAVTLFSWICPTVRLPILDEIVGSLGNDLKYNIKPVAAESSFPIMTLLLTLLIVMSLTFAPWRFITPPRIAFIVILLLETESIEIELIFPDEFVINPLKTVAVFIVFPAISPISSVPSIVPFGLDINAPSICEFELIVLLTKESTFNLFIVPDPLYINPPSILEFETIVLPEKELIFNESIVPSLFCIKPPVTELLILVIVLAFTSFQSMDWILLSSLFKIPPPI